MSKGMSEEAPPGSEMTDEEIGVKTSRLLREALGYPDEPGTCRDCGGFGVVPSLALTREHDHSLWIDCPTCGGSKLGGRA